MTRRIAWVVSLSMHALACVDMNDQFSDIDAAALSSSDASLLADAAVPPGDWRNVTGNLANMPSECGNLTSVFAKPDEDMLIAGIALKGLWASRDGGGSWQPLGTGSSSAVITNRPTAIVFDPQVAARWWEAGIYNGGGVYRTIDDGTTFTQEGDVTHCDAVSVDTTDPARRTLVAGGHEQSQTLYRSTDEGATWTSIGGGLPADTDCTNPLVLDAQTILVGCGGFHGGATGIYRTTDGGSSWLRMTSSGGALAPLRTASGAIYWTNANGPGLTRSMDSGQHWVDIGQGVVDMRVRPIELPDGRVATLGSHQVVITADQGGSWKPASARLPYDDASGLAYSPQRKAFFIWHFSCGGASEPVPADAIMRFDFDYQQY